MRIRQKIATEGLYGYCNRRISLLLGILIMLITVGNLLTKISDYSTMSLINVLLCAVALINFALVIVTYARYNKQQGKYSIKYTKLALRLSKIILGVAGFGLSLPLLLSSIEQSVWSNVANISLVSIYSLYVVIQLLLLLIQLCGVRISQRLQHRRQQRQLAKQQRKTKLAKHKTTTKNKCTKPKTTTQNKTTKTNNSQ